MGIGLTAASAQTSCIIDAINSRRLNITDFDTLSIRFRIENTVNNDLLDPNQGVCGLRIEFDHENLSDLDIRLTAPSGETITLIGASLGNTTVPSPIFPISHNVLFVPISVIANFDPDLSLDGTWDNNNPGWGPGPYTGSYYPYFGDLDTSFTGQVNGIWEITASDNFLNQSGLIRSIEIIFCDDRLDCSNCEAEAGSFMPNIIEICSAEILDLSSVFTAKISDTSAYSEEFLIYRGDSLIRSGISAILGTLDTGQYFVTSIAAAADQLANIRATLYDRTYHSLRDTINRVGGQLCAQVGQLIVLNVFDIQDTIVVDTFLCQGDFLVVAGDTIRAPDTIYVRQSSCDTLTELRLFTTSLSIASPDSVFLGCDNLPVAITIGSSGGRDSVQFGWRDPAGHVNTGNTNRVDQLGVYFVSAFDGFCTIVDSFVVFPAQNFMTMDASVSTNTITCTDTAVQISLNVNFVIDSLFLKFQNVTRHFDLATDRLLLPGNYEIIAYGNGSCIKRDTLTILENKSLPSIQVSTGTLDCENTSTRLQFGGDSLNQFVWLDANGFPFSRDSIVVISQPGSYFLRAVGLNGCASLVPASVNADTTRLAILNLPQNLQLTCADQSILVSPMVDTANLRAAFWLNDNNDTIARSIDVEVLRPGIYTLTVLGDNGCDAQAATNVVIDTLGPVVDIQGQSLNCLRDSVVLNAEVNVQRAQYLWRGPSIRSDARLNSIVVNVDGIYTLNVLNDDNGCSTNIDYTVTSDFSQPTIVLGGQNRITCDVPEVTISYLGLDSVTGLWISPLGDSIAGLEVNTSIAGDWTFVGTTDNGCFNQASIVVNNEANNPIIDLPIDHIFNCSTDSIVFTLPNASQFRNVEWRDSTGVLSTAGNFVLRQPGLRSVYVEDQNGCSNILRFNIVVDTIRPVFDIRDTTLTCALPAYILNTNLNPNNFRFSWTLGSTFIAQTPFLSVTTPGNYTLRITNNNNACAYQTVFDVGQDILSPAVVVQGDTLIDCQSPRADVHIITEANNMVSWFFDMDTVSTNSNLSTNREGRYSFVVVAENGCTASGIWQIASDVELTPIDPISIELQCNQNTQFVNLSNLPVASIAWIQGNGQRLVQDSLFVTADFERVEIIETNGCLQELPITVLYDTTPPPLQLTIEDMGLCSGRLPLLSIGLGVGQVIDFWAFNGDTISNEIQIFAEQEGMYSVQIRDTRNQCSSKVDTLLVVNESPFTFIDIQSSGETCLNAKDGRVQLNFQGGNDPVMVIFRGERIDAAFDIDTLASGNYSIRILDFLGCSFDTSVTIAAGATVEIDLGSDFTVQQGTPITIRSNVLTTEDYDIEWFIDGVLQSDDTTGTLSLTPFSETTVVARATLSTGCFVLDTVLINVTINRDLIDIYMPQVFSPMSMNPNNQIIETILPSDIVELRGIAIYDRWGQKVHELNGITQRSPFILWDGRMNGQLVNSGVYTYYYELISIYDDEIIRKVGDITVLH